ncbi:MAG: type II toxin-antitoxin system RelE/ParE family toxin [Treponema sp.]|nr:type II toxin-antitoxin system RelE/ParE family toxin [Treponema sp.]
MREVNFYRTADGRCPVREFLDGLPESVKGKIFWAFNLIETADKVPEKFFKHLSGTKMYECRIAYESIAYRFLGFFHNGNLIILTNGFVKKVWKTPRTEIKTGKQRMKDFLENGGFYERCR